MLRSEDDFLKAQGLLVENAARHAGHRAGRRTGGSMAPFMRNCSGSAEMEGDPRPFRAGNGHGRAGRFGSARRMTKRELGRAAGAAVIRRFMRQRRGRRDRRHDDGGAAETITVGSADERRAVRAGPGRLRREHGLPGEHDRLDAGEAHRRRVTGCCTCRTISARTRTSRSCRSRTCGKW